MDGCAGPLKLERFFNAGLYRAGFSTLNPGCVVPGGMGWQSQLRAVLFINGGDHFFWQMTWHIEGRFQARRRQADCLSAPRLKCIINRVLAVDPADWHSTYYQFKTVLIFSLARPAEYFPAEAGSVLPAKLGDDFGNCALTIHATVWSRFDNSVCGRRG